ncbi:MAG: magnesium transporter CorA [Cytophagales bacterium]|nr:MAG: magnesium transporter CorA [Cytophagales bacterium]
MIKILQEHDIFTFEWVYVTNPNEKEIKELAERYNLNKFWVEDCLQPAHLPKYEKLGDIDFMILRRYDEEAPTNGATIREITRKIAVFYSDNLLITVHRAEQPFIQHLKEKYIDPQICNTPIELLHKLLDFVLHTYEEPANQMAEKLNDYENLIFATKKQPNLLENLYTLKRRTDSIKRTLLLSRDIINYLRKLAHEKEDIIYTRDTLDEFIHLENMYETLQEDINNLLNIYFSVSSQRTNEIVQVLTIFSVFFMPLTFIVGVYGMNFKYMPELEMQMGYWAVWGVMILITIVIFAIFRLKKWL